MKKIYVLLLGLVCSAVVIAQTTEWVDTPAEDVVVEDVMTEDMLVEESDQAIISDELLAEIQQDCQLLAQQEGVAEEHVAVFVEVCGR